MTKILFDSQCFDMQRIGGVSRSFAEIISRLPMFGMESVVAVKGTDNVYLKPLLQREQTGLECLSRLTFRLKHASWWRLHSWRTINQAYSQRLLERGGFDLLHATFFNPYFLPLLNGKPFVLTIHDMIPETYPQLFPDHVGECRDKRLLAQKASAIVAVSEYTKERVVELLGVDEQKVTVVYHGSEPVLPNYDFGNNDLGDYLLYVGDRRDYKNFQPFVEAALPVLRLHPSLRIVCTGMKFTAQETLFFRRLGVEDRLLHAFAASDGILSCLYHHALAFVYPSMAEGFGIPILEAWRAGCPVLLNRASCFPEIASDAAVWFSMQDGNLTQKLEEMVTLGGTARRLLVQKGYERLTLYSWEKSAAELSGLYKRILEK